MNRDHLRWGLEELASQSKQERLWPGPREDSNEVSCFAEAVCVAFDHGGLGRELDDPDSLLTPEFRAAAEHLNTCIDAIDPEFQYSMDIEIIRSEPMRRLRVAAAELLALLNAMP